MLYINKLGFVRKPYICGQIKCSLKVCPISTALHNIPISSRNCLIYIASFIAFAIVLYFAYIIIVATVFCFAKVYANSPLKKVKHILVIDLQLTISLA